MRQNQFEWDPGFDIDAVKKRIAEHLGGRGLQTDPLKDDNPFGHGLWDHLVATHDGRGPFRGVCSDCAYLEAHWRIVEFERERVRAAPLLHASRICFEVAADVRTAARKLEAVWRSLEPYAADEHARDLEQQRYTGLSKHALVHAFVCVAVPRIAATLRRTASYLSGAATMHLSISEPELAQPFGTKRYRQLLRELEGIFAASDLLDDQIAELIQEGGTSGRVARMTTRRTG